MEGTKLTLTPMMQQYMQIKEKYKGYILFFRLGDFYEMFFDDAILASRELEIALTGRDCGKGERAPMCGVPYHSADSYLNRLIEKGYRVAICEQIEDASQASGIVKRDVVRIVTPGTIIDSKTLDEKSNNFLCCLYMDEKGVGLSYTDISTGEMYTTEFNNEFNDSSNLVLDELGKIKPKEVIVNTQLYNNKMLVSRIEAKINTMIEPYHEWTFQLKNSINSIKEHFKVVALDGYGIAEKEHATIAVGALIGYLNETQRSTLNHLNSITSYTVDNYMMLDFNTRKNLELIETIRGKNKKGSLLWVLDKTSTAMGGRLLKKWIEEPLMDIEKIEYRLNCVQTLVNNVLMMDELDEALKRVYDMERLMGRISFGSCNGRDIIALRSSIAALPKLKSILLNSNCPNFIGLGNELDELKDIHQLIEDSIIEDPPLTIKEGGIIKSDYNEELGNLRDISTRGKDWLSKLEEEEKKRTGIKFLRVGYNKIFGYYIEVTKSNIKLVPDSYVRKQTLANAERYITPELKEMEAKILGAEDKMMELEYVIFCQIRDAIKDEVKRIQNSSKIISLIDTLNSIAKIAYKNNYVRPIINNDGVIKIENGRHPVIEKMLDGELFVPNDTYLDKKDNRVTIITGPNMAGKSTYMRQVAIITLMAQIGSFVPADEANISIVDRIFTRIGASDDLSQGQSTFMVEMSEVANIVNNATENSLIILDEIGRGTSTYDGLSIAWAVVEYISDLSNLGAKTLFATHYHELTELEGTIEGVKNYKILVKEKGEEITFLRKITRGGADKSYGIEVARLAGVNKNIIMRAKEILEDLEERNVRTDEIAITEEIKHIHNNNKNNNNQQLDIFEIKEKTFIDKIKTIDIMSLTPMEAMNILFKLVQESKNI